MSRGKNPKRERRSAGRADKVSQTGKTPDEIMQDLLAGEPDDLPFDFEDRM